MNYLYHLPILLIFKPNHPTIVPFQFQDWAEFNAATSTIDALRPSVRSPLASPRHSPRAARRTPALNENAYGELRAPPLPPRKSLSPAEPAIASASSVQDLATASAQGKLLPDYVDLVLLSLRKSRSSFRYAVL